MENKTKMVIDAIYDENNEDELILQDENGKELIFEQVALIPMADADYVILAPVTKIEGVEEDQALVFKITNEEKREDKKLELITDEEIVDEIFEIFESYCEDQEHSCGCGCCDHEHEHSCSCHCEECEEGEEDSCTFECDDEIDNDEVSGDGCECGCCSHDDCDCDDDCDCGCGEGKSCTCKHDKKD